MSIISSEVKKKCRKIISNRNMERNVCRKMYELFHVAKNKEFGTIVRLEKLLQGNQIFIK